MKRTWIKFIYERDTYVVELERISTFARAEKDRLMFWLPDGKVPIILRQQTNPDAYQQILDYVEKTTGQSLSCELKAGLVIPAGESAIKSDASSKQVGGNQLKW
jgi:hypothetical protein